jgi:hypothetical protein
MLFMKIMTLCNGVGGHTLGAERTPLEEQADVKHACLVATGARGGVS